MKRITSFRIIHVFFLIYNFSNLAFSQKKAHSYDIPSSQNEPNDFFALDPLKYKHYVDFFNVWDAEPIKNAVDNAHCWEWMLENIPFFECPDSTIEEMYYFRWWVYRKHIKKTPAGFVITEFLPEVSHSQKYNTISCSAALHIEEGRWLKNQQYLLDYIKFWFSEEANPRQYSTWLVDAIWNYSLVSGDYKLSMDLMPQFVDNYSKWEETNLHESGLFWSEDDRDGGEYSISSHGLRPTLNSYMFADAQAIAGIANKLSNKKIATDFEAKAQNLKNLIQRFLWDSKDIFFKNVHINNVNSVVSSWDFNKIDLDHNVREIYGFIPWKFNIPDQEHNRAWLQIIDANGFSSPFGLTTAEQRHDRFMKYRKKRCQWDGPVWPFASSLALKALANFVGNYNQDILIKDDYFNILKTYSLSQHRKLPFGEVIPWVGESLHPYTGRWFSRDIILEHLSGVNYPGTQKDPIRGKDYNHSTYCDLIINDLIGLKPRYGNTIEINPLVPDNWDWFCLDNVLYHGKNVTIYYDKSGQKYKKGKGFFVVFDGKPIFKSNHPEYAEIEF